MKNENFLGWWWNNYTRLTCPRVGSGSELQDLARLRHHFTVGADGGLLGPARRRCRRKRKVDLDVKRVLGRGLVVEWFVDFNMNLFLVMNRTGSALLAFLSMT